MSYPPGLTDQSLRVLLRIAASEHSDLPELDRWRPDGRSLRGLETRGLFRMTTGLTKPGRALVGTVRWIARLDPDVREMLLREFRAILHEDDELLENGNAD